jgi:hypothetical protein
MSDSTPTGRRTRAGKTSEQKGAKKRAGGRLRIGDNWNVITVIRGKERGKAYLKIVDDGEGVPRDR